MGNEPLSVRFNGLLVKVEYLIRTMVVNNMLLVLNCILMFLVIFPGGSGNRGFGGNGTISSGGGGWESHFDWHYENMVNGNKERRNTPDVELRHGFVASGNGDLISGMLRMAVENTVTALYWYHLQELTLELLCCLSMVGFWSVTSLECIVLKNC